MSEHKQIAKRVQEIVNAGSSVEAAVEAAMHEKAMSKEELIRALEAKQFFGTADRLRRGVIDEEQAEGELHGTRKPEGVTRTKPPDPWEFAAKMHRQGVGKQESWSRWVQATSLRPGMDAKDWYKIYDATR